MSHINSSSIGLMDDLTATVARKAMVDRSMVLPFVDYTDFLADMFSHFARPSTQVISAGLATPDVEIAADRADLRLAEQTGRSPFAGDLNSVLATVTSSCDIIYVANPNRVTGANFSALDLEELAQAVPDGGLIVDEYYYDYFGITAQPIIDRNPNVVVLRSFTASFSIRSSDAGFLMGAKSTVEEMRTRRLTERMSPIVRKTVLATLSNDEAIANRMEEVHEESLRVATTLNRMGAQCRICAADFVLLRVADPTAVGNALTRKKIDILNLHGYPEMQNYLSYRVQSPFTNDRIIAAFEGMAKSLYALESRDTRAVTLRQRGERLEQADEATAPTSPTERKNDDASVLEVERETVAT